MISAHLYQQRRTQLSTILNGIIVIAAFDAAQQTNDASAPFVQESSFFWLTGITEPGWRLIISNEKSTLVATNKTEIQRIFDGGMSFDEAKKISGVQEVISADEYKTLLQKSAEKNKTAYTIFKHPHSKYYDFVLNPALKDTLKELKTYFDDVQDCRQEISKLKAIKSPEEIELIQKAINISIEGFHALKAALQKSNFEYELEAELTFAFRHAGAQGHAYEPIVGTGKNACTLHYIENNDPLPKNGMVLVDAGARVGGYAADITRTYAIGTPTKREKEVHDEVEKAHQAVIACIKPGLSFETYHKEVDTIMQQALKNLGLLKKKDDYRRYFPHAISHGLGIDVHDSLGGYDTFQPDMVLTVEPGIYIPEEGIGVRIEDDILVTEEGHRNLSGALPTSL